MQKVVTNSNLNLPLNFFFFSPILTNNNLLLKIYCENIMVEFLNQDFLFFILFFILSFHSPPHTCPLSPFFYFFFSSKTFQQHHLLFSSTKRERQRDKERGERLGDRRSPCRQRSRFTMHYHVCRPTAARPPPHHQAGSDQLVLSFFFFFFFSFFIFACSDSTLFYKNQNLFCVLCLDYVRNGVRSACSFLFFFSFLLVLIQLYFKNWILFCVLCFVFGLCEKRRK